MLNERWAVAFLRIALAGLFTVLVVFQVMSIPGQFAYMAQQDPELAHLRWPLTGLFVFWLACVQVVIVAIWKLLTLVKEERIFTDASRTWVDVIVWAIAAAWTVLVGVFLYVGFNADDPGPVMILLLLLAGLTVLGLLMIVMRALLRRATTLQTDMEQVI